MDLPLHTHRYQGPISYQYRCLPDTVDPRGPKGK